MKICPACGSEFTDEANFCPMDASKLPPPVAAAAPKAAAPDAAPAPAQAPPAAATMLDAPKPLGGRFVLGAERARTPTGTLFDGADTTDGSAVQIKLVDPKTLPTAMMADRALRELKQLTKVKNDKIARVIDQGKSDDGRIYVVTEVLGGATLEQLVERAGALPFDRARTIVLAVGEALTEAQKVGVIHRDVAPRNVMVDGDRIKVTDFGLAEAVSDKVFGTPAFLSPEQAEGKPVDQRSNIYSLGALFYYMLAGGPPFQGERDTLVQQHLHAQPQPPSARRPGISPEIDKLVLKALEKSGGRRHLTLRQLLNELGALAAPAALGAAVDAPILATDLGRAKATVMNFGGGSSAATTTELPDTTERVGRVPDLAVTSPSLIPPPMAGRNDAVTVGPFNVAPAPAPYVPPQAHAPVAAPAPAHAPVAAPAPVHAPVAAPAQIQVAPAPAPSPPPVMAPQAPPVQTAPRPQPVAAKPAPAPAGKKGFRETAWFKKGELEEEMAKRAAELNPNDPLAGPAPEMAAADVDPATLTADDRARLSLKTGRTEAMPVIRGPAVGRSSQRMSDEDMLAEVDSSKKWLMIAGVAVAALAVIGALVYFLLLSGPNNPKAAVAPASVPAAVATAPPVDPKVDPHPAASPSPSSKTPADCIQLAESAVRDGKLDAAVDQILAAREAGAKAKDLKRVDNAATRSLFVAAKNAAKKRDRDGEAAALSGIVKLHPTDRAVRARLAKLPKK